MVGAALHLADRTPDYGTTPESYLGTDRLERYEGSPVKANRMAKYTLPFVLDQSQLAYGGYWNVGPQRIPYRIDDPRSLRSRRQAGAEGPVTLKASMPGRVVRILVAKGDTVAAHQAVIVVEAMKMELPIAAEHDGIVKAVHCIEGDLVQAGQPLIELE